MAKSWIIVPLLVLASAPAQAQDVYENAITNHAEVVTQGKILDRNLQIARNRQNARNGVTPAQAQACANKERFRREHGAEEPRVQRLYALCRQRGL